MAVKYFFKQPLAITYTFHHETLSCTGMINIPQLYKDYILQFLKEENKSFRKD